MSKVEGIMSRRERFKFLHADKKLHVRQNTKGNSSFENLLNLYRDLYQI